MRGADRRKPSKKVVTSSTGSAAEGVAGFVSLREAEHVRTCIRTGAFPHLPVGGSGSHVHCSHSLAGAAIQRFAANRREVNELALTSKLQSPGRLTPPGTSPGPVRRAAPTSRTPASSGILGDSCHRAADFPRCRHPRLKPSFVIGDRTPPFQRIARLLRPIGADVPLIQLRNHDFDRFVTKLHFLYTPTLQDTAPRLETLRGATMREVFFGVPVVHTLLRWLRSGDPQQTAGGEHLGAEFDRETDNPSDAAVSPASARRAGSAHCDSPSLDTSA